MYHASGLSVMIFFQDPHCICRRFPGMDDYGKIFLHGQLQLPGEPIFLNLVIRLRPVVVQADFADCQCPLILKLYPDLFQKSVRHLRAVLGMNSQRAINVRIFVSKFQAFVYTFRRCRYIYNRSDPRSGERLQQFFPVIVKSFIVIMCMCIKYHILPL